MKPIVTLPDCSASFKSVYHSTFENVFIFNENQRLMSVGNGWQTFFKNTDPINCPYIECKLLNSRCEDKIYNDLYLTISENESYKIYANVNQIKGYRTTVCLKCTNQYASLS